MAAFPIARGCHNGRGIQPMRGKAPADNLHILG